MHITLTKRQYDILRFLEHKEGWTTSKELGKSLHCSDKTIQNDIHEIQQILPLHWSIETRKGRGIQLVQPENANVSSMFTSYEDELMYDILERLTLREGLRLREISDTFSISPTLTNQLLRRIEQTIHHYHLQLKTSPYQIVGSEGFIRVMLFEQEYLKVGMSQYQQLVDDTSAHWEQLLIKYANIQLSPYGLQTFIRFLTISIQRIQNGFHASALPDSFYNVLITHPLLRDVQPLFEEIEKVYALSLSQNERLYLYIALIHSEFRWLRAEEPNFFQAIQNPEHPDFEFHQFKCFSENKMKQHFSFTDETLRAGFNVYMLAKLRTIHPLLDYHSVDLFYNDAVEYYDLPVQQCRQLLNEWATKHHFRFLPSDVVLLTLILQQHIISTTTVRVLYVTSRFLPTSTLTIRYLEKEFGGQATFTLADTLSASSLLEVEHDFDFIITDALLHDFHLSTPHLLVHTMLSQRDLTMIRETMTKLKEQKERDLLRLLLTAQK